MQIKKLKKIKIMSKVIYLHILYDKPVFADSSSERIIKHQEYMMQNYPDFYKPEDFSIAEVDFYD